MSDGEETLDISANRRPSAKIRTHRWTRLLHVYTSMISFVVVLFFALTGITLNHPNWTFGSTPSRTTVSGTLPIRAFTGNGVDWLNVSEYFRNEHGVRGSVSDRRSDANEGSLTFKGPGYEADATFKIDTHTYELTIDSQGVLGFMNDLHKGRDTRSSWKWLIDVSGGFLALVAFTGIALQFFLRKRRRSAVSVAAVGGVVVALLTWLAAR